jgi:hypothetical protein
MFPAATKPNYANVQESLEGIGKNKISQLKASLIGQQNTINKRSSHSEPTVCAKCVMAEITAKEGLRIFKA